MAQQIAEWIVLKCECGGDRFTALVQLKYKTDGGTTASPAGHVCISCQAVVDNAYMIRLIERQEKIAQIKRLQAEVAEEVPEDRGPAKAVKEPAGR